MDPGDLVASRSDEEVRALLDDFLRLRAVLEDDIDFLLHEVERRRAYRHQSGHHNGALRGRAVRRAGPTSELTATTRARRRPPPSGGP